MIERLAPAPSQPLPHEVRTSKLSLVSKRYIMIFGAMRACIWATLRLEDKV